MKRRPRKSKQRIQTDRSNVQIGKVIQLEKEVWKAARARNATSFAKLVPADALMIFQTGIVTQPDYIATMHGRTLQKNKISDLRGHMPNRTTVILTYQTVRGGNYKGNPFPSTPVIESTIWIKRGRRWVAVLNQETPIEAKRGSVKSD
jgi:hypothetical protein